MLVDTHAHIHFDQYADDLDAVLARAKAAKTETIICVGVDEADSAKAIILAADHPHLYATAGLHPHEASRGQAALGQVTKLARSSAKVVAVGECGLDFFRNLSTREEQEAAFRFQIELALELNLPMVWHVRDAFNDFFQIVDQYKGLRGIVHCFTGNRTNMERAVDRGFLVALNGIMTFTRDQSQLEAAKHIPLNHLVLETDCPFLTPAPKRGQQNEPANLKLTAQFLADLRDESFADLSTQTTTNALRIFSLEKNNSKK